jgi:hypothetical protein
MPQLKKLDPQPIMDAAGGARSAPPARFFGAVISTGELRQSGKRRITQTIWAIRVLEADNGAESWMSRLVPEPILFRTIAARVEDDPAHPAIERV